MSLDLMKIGEEASLDVRKQGINLPANYSPQNALAAAYLVLKQTKDKNKKPVLDVCTEDSIKECLFSMIVQGLNPIKHQCAFIAYGTKLTLSREYMGSIAVAKRVDSTIKDIRAQVIYKGEKVKIDTLNGRKHITTEVDFETMMNADIIGAYAIAVDENEEQIYTDIMSLDQIKQSWKQSKLNPVTEKGNVNSNSTHGKFEEEMVKKTIYNRLCKKIINTSDDETLLQKVEESDEQLTASDAIDVEIEQNANQKVIDFEPKQATLAAATIEQARTITGLSTELNQKEKMMSEISGYFGKDVKKISELTFDQAAEYITVLDDQVKESNKNDKPEWAKKS